MVHWNYKRKCGSQDNEEPLKIRRSCFCQIIEFTAFQLKYGAASSPYTEGFERQKQGSQHSEGATRHEPKFLAPHGFCKAFRVMVTIQVANKSAYFWLVVLYSVWVQKGDIPSQSRHSWHASMI